MVTVDPLSGAVVRPEQVSAVVSPAYDALTPQQRRQFRVEHPLSYLHVTRTASDEVDADTVDNATLVARGRVALENLLAEDVFDHSIEQAFYAYELDNGDHRQRGLVCEVSAREFGAHAKPHEATRPERAALLAEHFQHVRAASSPIACTLRRGARLSQALSKLDGQEPLFEHRGADGLTQRVWRIVDPDIDEAARASLVSDDLFIIDGHHRAAAAAHLFQAGHEIPVLVAVFPPESLGLRGFHRLVSLPDSLSERELLRRIERRFRVETHESLVEPTPGIVSTYLDGAWRTVHFDERPASGSPLVRLGSLDPAVLRREILQGIVEADGATAQVEFMPDEGDSHAVAQAAAESHAVPFLVAPVTVADMVEVADGGLTMPAKSTYFVPKVRSGLFLRQFAPATSS